METYISILRGINVSGHNQIKMIDLKALYEGLKFKDVITYIQSGNVIFKFNKSPDQVLSKKIEGAISAQLQFRVPVIIRSTDEMKDVVATNPFLKQRGIDLEKLHVTFLAEIPEAENASIIQKYDYSPDKFQLIGKEVFLYCPNGYGNTRLSNTFFENKLKVTATTRNWKTVNKLIELADQ